jgi:uncharacterized membrane protein YidH (DUF202 family)
MKSAGIILLIAGLVLTVYAGFNYLANEMMKDRGGVSIAVDLNQSVNWQPYIGIGVMIIGASVLLLLRRKSAIL